MIWTNIIINMFREMDLRLLELLGTEFDHEMLENLEGSEIDFLQDLLLGRLMRAALLAERSDSEQVQALIDQYNTPVCEDPLWDSIDTGLGELREEAT